MSNLMLTSVTTKGQATIPKPIRVLLGIREGRDHIGFRINKGKVEIVSLKVDERPLKFTKKEWEKIEKLANEKTGKRFNSARDAIKYLESL